MPRARPSLSIAVVLALVLALGVAAGPLGAQEPARAPAFASPVLTLNQEALFAQSEAGRAVRAGIEAEAAELAAENRRIEAALAEEERRLTAERAAMAPEAFAPLARAFDEKVVALRAEQDAKARALARREEEARQAFYRRALPIVATLVQERGAVAVLQDQAVVLAAEQIDITEAAIARIDAELQQPPEGEGPRP